MIMIIMIEQIKSLLKKEYPKTKIALNYNNHIQLLVSVILSAQCTDKKVNEVTKKLFEKYKTAKDFSKADIKTLEQEIRSTGFYRNKAKNIKNSCTIIQNQFKGNIPKTMEEMLKLPGVARKTANIVLYNAYNINSGIAVDTHVKRLAFRLGLTKNTNPDKIEKDLTKIIPKNQWGSFPYLIIEHGRKVCKAPVPFCSKCILNKICPKNGVIKSK